MASIWKDERTPHFVACITGIAGLRRVQWKRSTHTGDRKKARRIADELEEAAQGKKDTWQVRQFLDEIPDLVTRRGLYRVFDEVIRKTVGGGLGGKSVRAFLDAWLERTRGEVAKTTVSKYERVKTLFLESLGGLAEQDLTTVKREDITRFRDAEAGRASTATANNHLKVVRIMFGAAEADGLIVRNEARLVKRLKSKSEAAKRRAFTMDELQRVLAVAGTEWRSMVITGLYTGARLGDVARLTWQSVDMERGEIRFATRKTGRDMVIPIAEPLRTHLLTLPAGDDPRQPLHPKAFKTVTQQGRTGTLSNQFSDLLAQAGLVDARKTAEEAVPENAAHHGKRNGKGRASRRVASEITFHSLRHTATSLLKSAGVSDAVAMDIIGHESAEMSRHYTKIEDKAKRDAVNALPDVLNLKPSTKGARKHGKHAGQ